MSANTLTTEGVIERLREYNGNQAAVARSYGVTRSAVSVFIARHPTCRAAFDEARERMLDVAESILYKKVMDGETQSLHFYLRTQGRKRGYIERQEHVVYTAEQIARMSDEELDAAYDRLEER